MAVLGICSGDPIVDTLREVFHANIIRVPEQRLAPLTVLAANGSKNTFRGAFSNLLKGEAPSFPEIAESRMAEVSGKKTKSMDVNLGLKILGGFLQGLGASGADLSLQFKKVQKVSYSFANVSRSWVDVNALGRVLVGQIVDKRNPAAAIFFGKDAYSFLVLDSTITSTQFSIAVDKSSATDFSFDVPKVQAVIDKASAGLKVESTTGFDLSFSGPQKLAFAFSCVQFALTADGTVEAMIPDDRIRTLAVRRRANPKHSFRHSPDRVLLSVSPGLLEIGR